jgi:hypothetical protein
VDVGRVAAGFEQREVHRVLASQKDTAGKAAAVTDDPKTLPVAFYVEVIRQTDTCRDKVGHGDLQSPFMTQTKGYDSIKSPGRSNPLMIKIA